MAANPVSAARRPVEPPTAASTARGGEPRLGVVGRPRDDPHRLIEQRRRHPGHRLVRQAVPPAQQTQNPDQRVGRLRRARFYEPLGQPVLDRVVAADRDEATGRAGLAPRPPARPPQPSRTAASRDSAANGDGGGPAAGAASDAASSGAAGRGRPERAAGSRSAAGRPG